MHILSGGLSWMLRLLRYTTIPLVMLFLSIMARGQSTCGARDRIVAYEIGGRVVVESKGWLPGKVVGTAPSVSPGGDAVAFLCKGNVSILNDRGRRVVELSKDPPVYERETFFEQRASWHPSGRWIAYTRLMLFRYDKSANTVTQVSSDDGSRPDVDAPETIWIVDVKSGRSRMAVGPMGNFKEMARTQQLGGGSVYEPIFSPDGKKLWFLNQGCIYETRVDLGALKSTGRPHMVDASGSLDFASPGASKGGEGAVQLAWNPVTSRLYYSMGRFWGSMSYTGFGCLRWKNGKWGPDRGWEPELTSSLRRSPGMIREIAFDEQGRLWVNAVWQSHHWVWRWVRDDGKRSLPAYGQRPSFGYAPPVKSSLVMNGPSATPAAVQPRRESKPRVTALHVRSIDRGTDGHGLRTANRESRDRIVAYELNGRVVVRSRGWMPGKVAGSAPAVSPSGDAVAFLRKGNVCILDQRGRRATQLTTDTPVAVTDTYGYLCRRVSWHPSGKWIAYTKPMLFRYDMKTNTLSHVTSGKESPCLATISTIWLADRRTGKSTMLLGPMGNLKEMVRTEQLIGGSVYEPIFSPDGRDLWFLNGGCIHEVRLDLGAFATIGKPRLVADTGSLDFESPSGAGCGGGAQQLAWDPISGRLYYPIGSLWGTSWQQFGYILWRHGNWGRDTDWTPELVSSVRKSPMIISELVFDEQGHLWVNAVWPAHPHSSTWRWVRSDGNQSLAANGQRPSFGYVPRGRL